MFRNVGLMSVMLSVLAQASAQECVPSERPALQRLGGELRQIVHDWLARDCFVGIFELEIPMRHAGTALTPVFWEAYHLGPDVRDVQDRSAALNAEWEAFRAWVTEDARKSLGSSSAQRLRDMSKEEFVREGLAAYEARYRDAALAGLGVVCSEECEAGLSNIAEDANAPGRFAAKAAVERVRDRRR